MIYKETPINGIVLGLAGFATYSCHDVLIKYLTGLYNPVQIIFFSVLFGFPLLTLYLLRNPKTGSLWPHHPFKMLVRVFSISIAAVSAFYTFSVLPLTQTYALLFLTPIIITALSVPFLGEFVGFRRWSAIVVGFLGVLVVIQPGIIDFNYGHLTGLIAVLAAAINAVITRKIGQKEKMSVMLLYPMLGNFFIMSTLLPFVYKPMPFLHLGGVSLISLLGFFAMFLIVSAFRSANAVIIAPMQYSQILWAALFGYLFFNEKLTVALLIGSSLVIISGLYIVKREWDKEQSLKPVLSDINARIDSGLRPRFAITSSFTEDLKKSDSTLKP